MAASREQLVASLKEISKDLMQLSNASNDNSDIMDVALEADVVIQNFLKSQVKPSKGPMIDDLQRRAGVV